MARMNNGLFGGFTGKLGNLIGYTVKGKPLLRTVGKISKPPTIAQLAVRKTIALLNVVVNDTLIFINCGFAREVLGTDKNPANAYMSANFGATLGSYPDLTIDYSKLLFSKGTLDIAQDATATLLEDGIEFIWDTDSSMIWNKGNDRTMLLVYFPDSRECICILSGAQRRQGKDFVPLYAHQMNETMHTYLAFAASDGKNVANSVYTGTFD